MILILVIITSLYTLLYLTKSELFSYQYNEIQHLSKKNNYFQLLENLYNQKVLVMAILAIKYITSILALLVALKVYGFVVGILIVFLFQMLLWYLRTYVRSFYQTMAKSSVKITSNVVQYVAKAIPGPVITRLKKLDSPLMKTYTKLFTMQELHTLIDNAGVGYDSEIDRSEIEIIKSTLNFGSKLVKDVMTPASVVTIVDANQDLTLDFMDNLSKTGFSRFPVTNGSNNFVGVLHIKDLIQAKQKNKVSQVMRDDIFFVNSGGNLVHVYEAFLKSKSAQFVVVDEFEQFAGVITIEDILEQIIGRPIIDEFDRYADMRQVALLEAKQLAKKRTKL